MRRTSWNRAPLTASWWPTCWPVRACNLSAAAADPMTAPPPAQPPGSGRRRALLTAPAHQRMGSKPGRTLADLERLSMWPTAEHILNAGIPWHSHHAMQRLAACMMGRAFHSVGHLYSPASTKTLVMLCRPAEGPGDTDAGRRLLEHAGRSSRALGSPRLSVRLIDYEVQQCPCDVSSGHPDSAHHLIL